MSSFISYDRNMDTSSLEEQGEDHPNIMGHNQATRSQNINMGLASTEYPSPNVHGNETQQHHVMMMIDSRICRDFLRGTCKRGPACKYIHQLIATPASTAVNQIISSNHNGAFGLVTHNSANGNIVCRDFQNGVCSRAAACRYLHLPIQPGSIGGTVLGDETKSNDYEKEEALMMIMMATHSSTTPMVLTGSCFSQPQSPSAMMMRDTNSPSTGPALKFGGQGDGMNATTVSSLATAPGCSPNNQVVGNANAQLGQPGTTVDYKVVPICRDYMKGRCDRGFRCRFRHITMADYGGGTGAKDNKLTQQQHYTPFKASLVGTIDSAGALGPSISRTRNYSTLTGATYPHIIENYDYLSGSFPHHQYHQHHIHPSGLPVVVSASSVATAAAIAGPLIISRQPTAAALQYSLPLSMQSCPLTYVPASATINIVDPILEPPLTKRRLYQQQQPQTDHNPNEVTNAIASTNSTYITALDGSDFNQNNWHQYNNGGPATFRATGSLSHAEKALVEENESLKQRLDTLKKQIAELNATVDMLLEQNRRLRLCGMGGGILAPQPPATAQAPHAHNGLVQGLANNTTALTLGYVQPQAQITHQNSPQPGQCTTLTPIAMVPPSNQSSPLNTNYPFAPSVPNTSNCNYSPYNNNNSSNNGNQHRSLNEPDVSLANQPNIPPPMVRASSPTNPKLPKCNGNNPSPSSTFPVEQHLSASIAKRLIEEGCLVKPENQ